MVFLALILLGLCFGSFVNAFVWRMHERKDWVRERSECVHCHHELAAKDLVPVLSWLWLRGKCRYCHKSISVQYPLVEAAVAVLFVVSYLAWPQPLTGPEIAIFGLWLVILVGLIALMVYDLRWMLLPNKLVFPLTGVAVVQAIIRVASADDVTKVFLGEVAAAAIGGGIFYILFQVSGGKWIGGGDVKLGFLLGTLVATPGSSLLVIFLASVLGTLVSLPLLVSQKLQGKSRIPFGPFLIAAAIVVVLIGGRILHWYTHDLLLLG